MDSQNGLPNPFATELQPHVLVQTDVFTVDSQKQQQTSLFSVDEQLIKDSLDRANRWKIVAEPFADSGEKSWANTSDRVTPADAALINSLITQTQNSPPKSIAQFPTQTIAVGKALAVSQIQAFLNRPDYLEQFKIAFGQDVDRTNLDEILQDWQADGSKLPKIKIRSPQILGKADGGYDTANNRIYLSSNLIERGDLSAIVPVIIEEFGHYLDSKIHPNGDAPGDEGEIFSKLVRGISISPSEYVTLINEDDLTTIILNPLSTGNSLSTVNYQLSTEIEQSVSTAYAIKAEKTVSFNGSSDLDGNPLDLSDDALVYGGKGFTFNGNSILPVKYDASGNPVKDSQGKLVLVDKAVTVAAGYLQANVNGNAKNKYAGLTPPQIVAAETVIVPLFADIKQQELNRRIPAGTITTTFNISTNPINTAAQWGTKFPPGGTVSAPKVVRVTGGGLNIPGTVNLSNYVIIVDSGDINFNGTGNLSNVTLVASNGNINLNSIQSDNLSVLAAGTINQNSGARFGGNSLFANGTGNITFNGATKGITANDNLRIVSAGNITFNGAQSTRGSFVSAGDFIANGSTNIYGTVSSKQNIIFNGSTTFTYANILSYSDSNAPVILASLVNDSGTSNSDKITNDGRISGTVTDASQIVEFKAGFDSKPVANFTDVLPYLTNGNFSFTKAQLETIYGGTIPDGSHTLNLIATDQYGNQSSVYPYTFTLDTTTPIPTLNLAATSDTGVVGDFRTKSALVTLTGKVEANAKVLLSGNPTPITADSAGNYTFANVALVAGNNSFTVTATDIAGNQQTFNRIVYRTSPPTAVNLGTPQIFENSANNTVVGGLSTIDPDGVDSYTYTLVNDAGGRFKLVGDKIQVANGSLLYFETTSQHQIQVRTTDSEGDSYLQTIAISVLNVNESPNNLLVLPTVILENSPNNTIVGNITSTDPDVGDSFSYSLVAGSGDGDNSKFTIAGNKLIIKNSPDFETQSSYTIRLKTTDAGGLTVEKQVTISVSNVNEAPTSLTLSNSTVAENSGLNGVIGTFTSTDPDIGDTRTYTLINGAGDVDNNQFTIVGDKLQLNPNPNFEGKSSYQLRVKVTDAGGLSYQQAFTVNITDVNEAPTNITIDTSNINENIPANSIVGNLTTIDPDAIDTATYTLVTGTGAIDNSKFSIAGNKLTINQSPDFETQSSYTIRIKTTDKGGLTYEKQLTIGVNNINEAPTSLTLSNNSVAENTGLNGVIGTFTSIDPDLGDTRTYTLTSGLGDVDNSQFTIVGDKLQLNSNPDFETKSSYQLRARVTDADGLSYEQAFTVNITDVNEAPTNITIDISTLNENTPANSIVGNLSTIDPDLVDTATYTLVSGIGDADNSKFAVAGNKLTINQSPDYEIKSSYSVRIRTTDRSGLTLDRVLTIGVNNLNEAPTALNISNTILVENISGGTVVGDLSAIDPDINDPQSFSLVAGVGDTNNSAFSIVGSQLVINNSPNFEAQNNYSLRVRVSDGTGLTFDRVISINITDINEAPTGMILSGNNIAENSSDNSTIGILTTLDSDSIDTANYTLTDDANGRFKLVGNELKVANGSLLDFEANTQHQITIVSTDTGGLTLSRQFTIGVTNVNEIPLALNLSNSTIAENMPIGSVIGNLSTIDPDLDDTHTYNLVNGTGSDDNSAFSIVNNQLKFLVSPNFETKSNYSLRVRTTDAGGLDIEKTLTVDITNVNEAPTQLGLDTTSIAENSPIGTLVGKFTSTDPDLGDTHSYSLVTGNGSGDNGKFSIINNELRLSVSPNFETQSVYHLRVQTTDIGGLTWEQEITVNILDLPENILLESTSFTKHLDIPITIPATGGRLSFKLNPLQFDGTDLNGINDALEVALVDAQGKSVVTPFQTGRTAFFNQTEGEPVAMGKGVNYDATTGIVTLDLTGVKPGSANLVFRLINNDTDTTTTLTLTDVTLSPNSQSPSLPVPQSPPLPLSPSPIPPTFFNTATDVSPSILADYHRTSFNPTTQELAVNVALKNQGSYGLNGTLVVVVNHISDPSVSVKNATGFTPEGLAYYTFTTVNGKLDPNSVTGEQTLVFKNPNGVQFSYDLTVLADLNAAPVIKSLPGLEVIAGKQYQYQVKAEDLNGDSLTYKLLTAPSGMTVDSTTGLVNWQTNLNGIGNYQLIVEVSDERGGIARQNYNLAVIDTPPNRPPVFTSNPLVDAAIGSVYNYQVIAKDNDGDSLIYSLISAPAGMTVDPNTGVVRWIPTGNQLGNVDVTLAVTDHRGEIAQQQFQIHTGAAVDNHAPLIVSDPVLDLTKIGGRIIVANDEWPLSDRGFQLAPDTANFANNITNWFTGGKPGNFYAYSTNYSLAGSLLAQTIRANGNTFAIGYDLPSNVQQLLQYDGIFVGEAYFDNNLLTDYVKAGGNVYVLAGAGNGGAANDAGRWNSFLDNFGLTYDPVWNTSANENATNVDSTHPLFKNVNSIYYSAGNGIRDLDPNNSSQKIVFAEPVTGNGLFGVYANSGNYQYQVKAVDIDNDHLTYALTTAPTGMIIDANTGLITWQNNDWNWTEKLDITVEVRDERGSASSQSFSLNLAARTNLNKLSGTVYVDDGTPRDNLVYFNDFENPNHPLTEWSNAGRGVTPIGDRHFLGRYGGLGYQNINQDRTRLSLDNLPEHENVTLSFDLYVNDSWNGSVGAYAPDLWDLKVVGGQTLLHTTFASGYQTYGDLLQSYPNNYDLLASINTLFPSGTGASEVRTLGYYLTDPWGDGVYRLSFTFDHTNQDLAFDFLGGTDESIDNESWSLDNVKVSVGVPKRDIQRQTIYLDNNQNGVLDSSEQSTLTDVNGNYSFNLTPGEYTVAQVGQTGLINTKPTTGNYHVSVRNGQSIGGLDFANIFDETTPQTPPEFLSNPLLTATIDRKYQYQAIAKDINFDSLTYDLVLKPDGMIIDAQTGVVTWLPTANQLGKTNAVIRVTDSKGGVDLQALTINVLEPNTPPIFINNPPGATSYNTPPTLIKVANNAPYNFQFKGIDPDSDAISYRLKTVNNRFGNDITNLGITIDSQTGLFSWNPTGQNLGIYTVIVGILDSKGAENIQTFTLELTDTITAINLPPVITSTPSTRTAIGQTYAYQIIATEPNSDRLSYSLINPPMGMSINTTGLLSWTPTAAQIGQSTIEIQISDERGGVTNQQFELAVVSAANLINHSPIITSIPSLITNIDKTYSYQLRGKDSDNDTLIWSLDNAPTGMVIDANTGILKWNPTSLQLGTHTIAVRLTDAYGLYVGQEYTLKVNGVNIPAQIQSTPNTIAGVNSLYKYQIKAIDIDGDSTLTYSLGRYPTGMIVDANTGLITWTPNSTQVGTQIIDILITDTQGAVTTQTYNLVVGSSPINQAPTITSTPKFTADINRSYQYQVIGTDPENQQLTYTLTNPPVGMVIDANTGLITWNNPTVGTTQITIAAIDASGAVAVQEYTLTGNQNHAPVITSIPAVNYQLSTVNCFVGNTYRYDIKATDSDNDALTYTLDNASTDAGLTIDKFGRITWKPTDNQIGIQPVIVTVTDTNGAAITQTYNLQVLADNIAPTINLVSGTNIANIGETISFFVQASDNVGIKSTQLLINNQAISLDSNGVGTYTVTTAGVITATAIVTDINGNTSSKNSTVNIIDPTDIEAPIINLDLSGIVNGIITGRTDIKGTVTDTNLDYYTLEVARLGSDNWQEVFRGQNSVTNGSLGKFDPSLLENDSYRIRLTAFDTNGHGSQVEDQLEVTGDLKLGNFRLSFTDLTIPVTGIPISLTRTYDSLTSGTTDDFGYGWRMEFRDTDLRTSLKPDPFYEQLGYRSEGFKFGTRIYITLPGGKREGFTFQPKQIEGAVGGVLGGRLYYPSFVSDSGVTSTLTVPGADIKPKVNINSESAGTSSGNPNGVLLYKDGLLFNLAGRPYVPQDDGFGNRYLLTTKDGTKYEINATTGDLESVTDTNGNTLTYSDTEIKSSTGVSVKFERDNQGRITSVTDPLGQKVVYGYDAKGDLVSVKDRDGNETKFGYNATRSHYLDKIVDPLGREAVKTEYDELGRLKKVLDVNGKGTSLTYDPNNSTETILDSYGKPTTYVYDIRGNVVNEIAANGGITTRTYDDDNNQLSETDADGVKTTYTYDDKRNVTSIVDANGNITRMAYGINNRITSLVGTSGITITSVYDSHGNLTSSKNADGLTTTYTYSTTGQLLTQTGVDGQIITYGYDTKGNPTHRTDSLGNATTAIYDNLGRINSSSVTTSSGNHTYTLSTSRTYDSNGKVTSVTDAQGNITRSEYNSLGQITFTTDAQGNITRYTYNDKGQVTKVVYPDNTPTNPNDNPFTQTEYDLGGRVTSSTSATGLVTRYLYDAMGRLIKTIYPDNTPNDNTDNPYTQTEYSLAGRVLANIDLLGNRTEYSYDTLGRVNKTKDILGHDTSYTYNSGGQITSVTDQKNRTTQLVYDDFGRQTDTISFDGSKSTITYDQLSRIKTQTNPLQQTVTYGYDNYSRLTSVTDALNHTTQYQYDNRGSTVAVIDALGHQTQFEYDKYNRKVATITADHQRTSTSYDSFNRVTQTQDFNGNSTGYSYNNLNQLTAVTLADNSTTNYTYDNLGRLTTTTDAFQQQTNYQYDNFNRKISTILALGQQNHQTYNQFGQLTNQTDFNGDGINYTYDTIGRLSQKSFTNTQIHAVGYTYDSITSQLVTVTDGRGLTSYSYDNKDRLASVTNPDSKQISYGYDIIGNLTALTANNSTTNYTYDKLNRLDLVKVNNQQLADYNYDAVGNLIETKLGDGTIESRTYDLRNRLTNLATVNSSGNPLSSYTYTLDANGNRTAVSELSGRQVNYSYDNIDRLTTESILDSVNGNRTISYTFDAVSNRLTRNDSVGGLTNYSYNQLNQVTSTTTGTHTTNYSYDNNGSLILKTDGVNSTNYRWLNDGENRLVGVTTPTNQIEYSYDAMGNRVKSVVNGTATNYLVDTNRGLAMVVADYDTSGNILKTYTSGNGLIRSSDGTQQQFYHVDGLGTVRLLTDATGAVNTRTDYDAFGRLLSSVSGDNVYQFTGERRDDETGLDYLRARYYDSELGRFISRDAFGGWLSSPTSQNKYLYADGNPVNFTDPSGYMTLGDALQTVAIVGILAAMGGTVIWGIYNVSNALKTPKVKDYTDGYRDSGSAAGAGSSAGGGATSSSGGSVLYNQGQLDGYSDQSIYGGFGSRLRFGIGGRSWTVGTGNSTSIKFSTSHDIRPAVQNALAAQGVRGVLTAGRSTQALRGLGEVNVRSTVGSEPVTPQIYTTPVNSPLGIPTPESFPGGNVGNIPPWIEGFDTNSGLGSGSEYFPGGSGDPGLHLPPYFNITEDEMWADDPLGGGGFREPVTDAVDHIMNDHPERLGQLGLNGAEDLQNLLDNLYQNGEVWTRPARNANEKPTKAYANPNTNRIFIDNIFRPTIVDRTNEATNYAEYLRRDGFKPD